MAKKAALRDQFVALRLEGKTYQAISEKLDVSRQSLINWSKDEDIGELLRFGHQMRIQSLLAKYELNREAHIQKHAALLQKCLAELAERDLSQVPLDKLLKMVGTLETQLNRLIPQAELYEDDPLTWTNLAVREFVFNVLD